MKTQLIVATISGLLSVVEGSRFLQANERKRVFLRYNGPRGHNFARKCAKSVLRDADDDDVVVMDLNATCFDQLRKSGDIIEVDWDNEVKGLDMTDIEFHEFATRQLQDRIPWGLEMIQADQLSVGNTEVKVCIVDSGISINHPDFPANNLNGTDTVKFYGDPWAWTNDGSGHGTHVAGIIAANSDGEGVVGVSPDLKVHITRALDDDGRGYESDIRDAVESCVEAGAKVINLSLGGPYMAGRSSEFYTRFVNEYGVIMVAAAGNDGNTAPVYPAGHPGVISVSAVGPSGVRWTGSSYGPQTELSAPGLNVLSTYVLDVSIQIEDEGYAYTAAWVNGSPHVQATGDLQLCDASDSKCDSTSDGDICMYLKGPSDSVNDLVEKCEDGGGSGLILFYNQGTSTGWSVSSPSIPVLVVGSRTKNSLMSYIGQEVTVGGDPDEVEYSYTFLTGTSMASPHVAAGAALVWSNHGECDNHQIRYALAVTAEHPDGSHSCDDHMGYGIIKLKDASDWLTDNPCDTWDVSQISQGGCTTLHE